MKKKTYYYNSFSDDFAGNNIKTKKIDENFKMINRNIFWKAIGWFLYRFIALPFVWLYCFAVRGIRFENRKSFKKLKGFFLYGNHVLGTDCFVSNMLSFPRKTFVVAGPDAVSIPGIKQIVLMLGAIPIPATVKGLKKLKDTVKYRYEKKNCICIFPEAHIWPYCNFIRPFDTSSFTYPAELGAPVVAYVTTFRKPSGIFKFIKPPAWTVHVSDPFYPDSEKTVKENKQYLHDCVYNFMKETADKYNKEEFVRYVKTDDTEKSVA